MPSSASDSCIDRSVYVQPSRQFFGLLTFLAIVVLPGCATYSAGIGKVEHETAHRDVTAALKSLDELKLGSSDRVLYHLDKATLLSMQGDFAASNQQLESAKNLMETLAATSLMEQAGSVTVNDTLKAYEGTNYEQLLIYAFKELNYLQLGKTDDAAVEARQFDIKQRLVAEKSPDASYLSGAFVRYLNGMVYEEVGDGDAARIDYRKAVEGYSAQNSVTETGVPAALKADLKRLEHPDAKQQTSTENDGEIVFILHNGLGPKLAEVSLNVANPNPRNGATLLRVALPQFVWRATPVARVELSEGQNLASSEIVENVNAIARKSLEDRLPGITARSVARLVIKNRTVSEVKKRGENAGVAGLMMGVFADVGAMVSERADTRSWSLLPGKIDMARLTLPAGTHDLKATFYDADGDVLAVRHYDAVQIKAGRKSFVTDYFIGRSAK